MRLFHEQSSYGRPRSQSTAGRNRYNPTSTWHFRFVTHNGPTLIGRRNPYKRRRATEVNPSPVFVLYLERDSGLTPPTPPAPLSRLFSLHPSAAGVRHA